MRRKSVRKRSIRPTTERASRELGDRDFSRARPARQVLPEILPKGTAARLLRPRGRPKSANPKRLVTLRLSAEVIEHFRSQGAGWQTRIDETLRKAAGV